MRKSIFIVALLVLSSSLSFAQITAPNGSVTQQSGQQPAQMAPMGYGASQSLSQLEQMAQETLGDLSHVRIEKWKVDARDKDQAQSNSESLRRNLTAALPTLIQNVRANPSSLAANVKLYRNLNAVYDVLSSFTESTGAFGSKDDYNALARDTSNIDGIRRALADQLEQMAAAQDEQLNRLTAQIHAQQAQAAAAPPKRVIVDDNAPTPKKPATKKKPAAPTTKASTPQ
jgi:hypothetical protein